MDKKEFLFEEQQQVLPRVTTEAANTVMVEKIRDAKRAALMQITLKK